MNVDDLKVYQDSMQIAERIWKEIMGWNYFAKDTVGKQLVRCADSIAANISEGFGRYHFAENRKFCYYSRGSLNETLTFIHKAKDRNLIEESVAYDLSQQLITLRKRLNAYIRSIGPTTGNSPS
ncbi:MAG: hypothetical protein CMO55_10525 [Verrucomicrobiales bacterium]|nr:hypothetical protein [Verrucomicrobiales bacterium]